MTMSSMFSKIEIFSDGLYTIYLRPVRTNFNEYFQLFKLRILNKLHSFFIIKFIKNCLHDDIDEISVLYCRDRKCTYINDINIIWNLARIYGRYGELVAVLRGKLINNKYDIVIYLERKSEVLKEPITKQLCEVYQMNIYGIKIKPYRGISILYFIKYR